jgi:hypothetical protein
MPPPPPLTTCLAQLKGFVNYLAAITVGRMSDDPTVDTIRHKIVTFMATWVRRSSIHVPKPVRQQVLAYFDSPEFNSVASLSTVAKEKRVAHSIDVELLLEAMWDDETHFRNPRERITSVCLTTMQSLTNDRPGAFTTHSNRPDCTDSIIHSHIDVRVQPNPDNPRSPFVFILIKINDIKGAYKDDSVFKYVVFYPEPDGSRSMCVVTALVTLLLQDDVFEHVHSAEEIFHPQHPPLRGYSLPMKPQWRKISVFRRSQFNTALRVWETHPTEAIPYPVYYGWLQHFSISRGFHRKRQFLLVFFDFSKLNCARRPYHALLHSPVHK